MDPIVEAALRKWPNVPHCHGWLALDTRGDWWMRDEPTQARGDFEQARGSRIEHAGLIAFIGRNYGVDEAGAWFFQNGPQRVYVDLELTPWVLRWPTAPAAAGGHGDPHALRLHTHTGEEAAVTAAWQDEQGRLLIETDRGLGLLHTQDMHLAADAVEAGVLRPSVTTFAEVAARQPFVARPRPPAQGSGRGGLT